MSHELVGSGDLSLGLAVLDPGKVHGVHRHPRTNEFCYVLEGVARVTLGDENIAAGPGT
ncbi:MAG: cupin domain-containing protein, partial [Thermoplasmata archaeon]